MSRYDTPKVPPATPPVVNPDADPADTLNRADIDGDSSCDGTRSSQHQRDSYNGSTDQPPPDKIEPAAPPEQPDVETPPEEPVRQPDEIEPPSPDFDDPGGSPDEIPPEPQPS